MNWNDKEFVDLQVQGLKRKKEVGETIFDLFPMYFDNIEGSFSQFQENKPIYSKIVILYDENKQLFMFLIGNFNTWSKRWDINIFQ